MESAFDAKEPMTEKKPFFDIFAGTDQDLRELCRALDEVTDEVSLAADRVEGILFESAKLRQDFGDLQNENRVLWALLESVRKEALEDGTSLSPWLYDEICFELNSRKSAPAAGLGKAGA